MTNKTFRFDLGSRPLFASEVPIVESAIRLLIDSAARHGKVIRPEALFGGGADVKANATVAASGAGVLDRPENAAGPVEHIVRAAPLPKKTLGR